MKRQREFLKEIKLESERNIFIKMMLFITTYNTLVFTYVHMYLHTAVHSTAYKAFHAKLCTMKKPSLPYNLDNCKGASIYLSSCKHRIFKLIDISLLTWRFIQFANVVPNTYNAYFIFVLAICKERIPDASWKKFHTRRTPKHRSMSLRNN
uniref:Uncharacterized protein n=1 Tax=Glossina palpalis gambiensis TaxID=67801 RepID=A0A1B0BFP0_9MUSC